MRKSTDAQIRAARKYDQNNTRLIQLKLNKKTDADILEFLEGLDNRQGFIKELIRKHMNGTEAIPTITKMIVDGEFANGQTVVVNIDGREFKRKVYKSSKLNDLAITVFNNEYARYEFAE